MKEEINDYFKKGNIIIHLICGNVGNGLQTNKIETKQWFNAWH